MRKIIKKILLLSLCLIPMLFSYSSAQNGNAPDFYDNFTKHFLSKTPDGNWEINDVRNFSWISAWNNHSLMENLQCLFYPNSEKITFCASLTRWWSLWDVMRYIWYAIVVLFLVIAWIRLLTSRANSEKIKPALSSILYIILWSVLFFGCIWILWKVLKFETVTGTQWLVENIQWDKTSLLFFVLSFMKAIAFIAAVFMIVVHGFKMMSSADASDKVKAGLKGLLNVIVALVIIKLIDYVYYIAQLPDIVTQTTDLIIEIAKIAWFIIWALMAIMLFYAGFLFITDQWNTENMKKAKNIIIWILVTALVIFSLLLIIYEIFNEFA